VKQQRSRHPHKQQVLATADSILCLLQGNSRAWPCAPAQLPTSMRSKPASGGHEKTASITAAADICHAGCSAASRGCSGSASMCASACASSFLIAAHALQIIETVCCSLLEQGRCSQQRLQLEGTWLVVGRRCAAAA
jgi:hypothetical protein